MTELAVHYHELALKRGNRGLFERALRDNLRRALSELGPCTVTSAVGRLLVSSEAELEPAMERATRVSGVAYVLRIVRMPLDLEQVARAVIDDLVSRPVENFRISAKRADKRFPMTSVDVERAVGAMVHEATGIPVKLKQPGEEVHLKILPREILVGFGKRAGPGGLPVGTGGRVAVLMSAGIDSPVAAWRMINRGCRAELVHFHSHPLVDRTTQEKARDLARVLHSWQFFTRIHMVPLAPIQTAIRLLCKESLRVILYRRFMVRIAERIAKRRRCRALVTGESLGQVASQTLVNLATVDQVAELPVLRPLIGTDKREIIDLARRLGTYRISIQPDQDCCSLFVPPHPSTRVSREEAEEAEGALAVEELVAEALAGTERVDLP